MCLLYFLPLAGVSMANENLYESQLTSDAKAVPAKKQFSNRAVNISLYATLAAIVLLCGVFAIRHPHLGTGDPVIVLANLSFLANLTAICSGVIGIIRGFRAKAGRSHWFAVAAVLLNGGWIASIVYGALHFSP